MARRKKVKIGDVFIIETDKGKCYGQIVADGINNCYLIFDIVSDEVLLPEQVVKKPIVFLTFTIDACIEEDKWKVIGNTSVPSDIVYPIFKVRTTSGYMVTNHQGNYLRRASDDELERLKYHKSVSPALLEHAVQARFGSGKWEDYFDEILYKNSK
jgi:hypothetical protein